MYINKIIMQNNKHVSIGRENYFIIFHNVIITINLAQFREKKKKHLSSISGNILLKGNFIPET